MMSQQAELGQGFRADRADMSRFATAIAASVDYRGDVTLILEDECAIETYVFDLAGDMNTGSIGCMSKEDVAPIRLDTSKIQGIEFSGRDTAEGKSFDTWIEKYVKKKLAGERASIECDSLEE